MVDLIRHREPVEAWLQTLSENRCAAVLEYGNLERSTVLSYLYARMMGLEASIDEWEAFARRRWKKLDHRAILEAEVVQLQSDIAELRSLTQGSDAELDERGRRRGKTIDDVATRISYLSKEMRGHIEHLSKDSAVHDRRALLLAGVEVSAKLLRKVFGRDASIWPAIEATLDSAWAEIDAKNQS